VPSFWDWGACSIANRSDQSPKFKLETST
jgi:hypothetical protein